MSTLYLSASTDAIDAALVTKDRCLLSIASELNIPLHRIAAIGDSSNDLPFLTIPGLGLRGAPSNAQQIVKDTLSQFESAIVLKSRVSEAFMEFCQYAVSRNITHVFADRDGVIIWREVTSEQKAALRHIFGEMGSGDHPIVLILTGSSLEQNEDFMHDFGLDGRLSLNPKIREFPFLLLAENGAVQADVLTGRIRDSSSVLDPSLLKVLKSDFRFRLISLIDQRVLPQFKLSWSDSRDDQVEKLFIPEKRTMLTINLPRSLKDGSDFRSSPKCDRLRTSLLSCMVTVAEALQLPYKLL